MQKQASVYRDNNMATGKTTIRADVYAFCSMLSMEILSGALLRVPVAGKSPNSSQKPRISPQPQAVRLRPKPSLSKSSKVSPLPASKLRKAESPQPRSVSRSPARPWLQSPEQRQRTPSRSSPSLHLSPGEVLRKSRCLNKIPFERVVDRLVVQLREWGEREGVERTKVGEWVEGLEQVKRERKEAGSVLVDISNWEARFPPTLSETFDLLKKALARPPSKGPYDFSVAQARTEAQQALTALSYKRLLEVGSCYQPSPELVSVSLVLFRLLARLVPALTATALTWKTFQTAAQQPGPLTSALKSAFQAVDSGDVDPLFLRELREQLAKINSRSLEMYDKTGSGTVFLKYLSSLVKVFEARTDQERWRQQEAPAFLGAEMPSRKKLLTSLYQRVFQPAADTSQVQRVAVIFQTPADTSAVSERVSVMAVRTDEETASFLQNLSFKKEEEHSLPVTRNASPDKDRSEDISIAPSVATPATEPKPEIKSKQRTKERRLSADAKPPNSDMHIYWTLETAFRRFLQAKASSESMESLTSNRLATLSEFQQSISPLTSHLSPGEVSKRDLLLTSVAEEQRYREEVRQVYLLLQRQHRVSRGKVGWMQLEVRRDKAKLAQGMQRLAKAKAK